ncbi:hypothetical protein ACFVWG_28285 [Kribbella sp. NPDC058245]|uniref:hypothetical protein n=1 Tax=Kribbella sp. NPDC058245 TaxID=3346399 RepID=UPI0036DFC358
MARYELIPPDSRVHQEFTRLYRLAQQQRPGSGGRWNGELYALHDGGSAQLNSQTGAIALSADRVLPYLARQVPPNQHDHQAGALRTVLEMSTHASMSVAPESSPHSHSLAAGIGEVRVATDFEAFANRAGYPQLTLPTSEPSGVHAAADSLLTQASGLTTGRDELLSELVATPVGQQFDRLANGVVRNRLREEVPYGRQEAARARLIEPMLHEAWPRLPAHDAAAGQQVADEIRTGLNSTVEELRHEHHPASTAHAPTSTSMDGQLRFLAGQASPTRATSYRPELGDGARGRGGTKTQATERGLE